MTTRYTIPINEKEQYLIVSKRKMQECCICGNKAHEGTGMRAKEHLFGYFVCEECIKKFIDEYNQTKSTPSFNIYLKSNVKLALKKEKIRTNQLKAKKKRVRCRLCRHVIDSIAWREHLKQCHNVGDNPSFQDYFVKSNVDIRLVQQRWYDPNATETEKITCGTVVNGAPKVKIIYTPLFSNRKKF